jgi:hypothetical protein
MLAEVASQNFFDSEWFAWCDIGCVRDDILLDLSIGFPFGLQNFPTEKMVMSMVGAPQQRDMNMINGISSIFFNQNENMCCHPVIRIQGGFFAGSATAIEKYKDMWEAELIKWMGEKLFIGKDQYMMYNLVLKDTSGFFAILPPDRKHYENEWFSFLPRLANLPIFSAKIQGGLGNQMFQVAAAYASACQFKGVAIFDRLDPITAAGNTPRGSYWNTMFRKCITHDSINMRWSVHSEDWQHRTRLIQPREKFTKLDGYFQSSFYFKNFAPQIRDLFRFDSLTKDWASSRLKPKTVAIHVRLGDYKKLGWVLPQKYFYDALSMIQAENIFVFSDEPEVVSGMFPGAIVIKEGSDIEQMCLITMCEWMVMSNSSYSWWAAFLGNHSQVFVSDPWFPNASYCPDIWEDRWTRIKVNFK